MQREIKSIQHFKLKIEIYFAISVRLQILYSVNINIIIIQNLSQNPDDKKFDQIEKKKSKFSSSFKQFQLGLYTQTADNSKRNVHVFKRARIRRIL